MKMNNTKWMHLSEIACLITKGTTPTTLGYEFQESGINFLKIECFDDNGRYIESKVTHISEECNKKLKRSQLEAGDILFSIAGAIGRVAVVTEKMLPANTNQALAIIRIKNDDIYLPYIKILLTSPIIKKQFERKKQGVAQLNISLKDINDLEIPLPEYNEQVKFASLFEKIANIINFRKCEHQLLDDLIKARFVEMFGDPVINPKGYPIVSISELFDVGSSKRVFESEWRESGVPFYRAREIVKLSKDGFVDNELFIEEDLYDKYKEKYGVPKTDDMMVTGVGTLGVCYIVKPSDIFYFKDGNTLWFKNKNKCSVRFIKEQYETDFVRKQIEANANVSTVGTYTISNAKETKVLLPSLEEQNCFDKFVDQIDKSKSVVQKALDEAQLLFDSLMQKYFG